MRLPFGITGCLIMAFIAAILFTGCAKHPQVAQPVTPPAPEAKEKEKKSAEPVLPPAASAESDARKIVVARVSGVELHMDALINMMNRLAPKEGGAAPESLEQHKKRSLDKLVLQELAYQQAKAQGLGVGTDKIDMAIRNLKENVGGEKEYADFLHKMSVTESELRDQVERSLTIELIYAKEVLAKVTVPEEEVRQEYEKQKHLYIMPEKATVIDVFVMKSDGKVSNKKAEHLLGKIKADAGKDPWKLVLDGSFIIRNLDINRDREKELLATARKMKPDELSGVIETPAGSHIIKLKDYAPERQLTFDEVRGRLELKFKVPAQEKRTQEWEQELRRGAKIEIVDGEEGNRQAEVRGQKAPAD